MINLGQETNRAYMISVGHQSVSYPYGMNGRKMKVFTPDIVRY